MRIIEDAFDQIKEATGIGSTDEIVTTFIKAEEQNYSLYNYVNRLNQETDSLEESNREIQNEIHKFQRRDEMDENEREEHIGEMRAEAQELREQIEAGNEDKENLKGELNILFVSTPPLTLQKNVEKMVELFKKSRFFLAVAAKMSYEEGTAFTESNVVHYLAELEEYISSLITYVAYKREEPHASIFAISLDKLNVKDFTKKDLSIEAPQATEIGPADGVSNVEDEEIIDSRDLYRRFMNLVDRNQINFLSQAAAKQQHHAPQSAGLNLPGNKSQEQ